ncbi:MAG: c-type cytochrome [Helicobacteraceae bacterium]|jgi:cytochrome c oxidase cbb3-type subunit 3|nr:c-type cytochrome [Helicobacteraceae bacterium]
MQIESLLGSNNTINLLGGIGFFAVVIITVAIVALYFKQIKEHKGGGARFSEGEWDGIKEYDSPVPVGWTLSFALMLIWAIWYWLAGYPLNAYTQIGELNTEIKEYNAQYEKTWSDISGAKLIAMGKSVYIANCSQCHGLTKDGLNGRAADLRKYSGPEWADGVGEITITGFAQAGVKGDIGTMPSFEQVGTFTDLHYKAVAAYLTQGGAQ